MIAEVHQPAAAVPSAVDTRLAGRHRYAPWCGALLDRRRTALLWGGSLGALGTFMAAIYLGDADACQCVCEIEPGVRRMRTPSGSRTSAIVMSPPRVACVTRRAGPPKPRSASLLRVASTSTK